MLAYVIDRNSSSRLDSRSELLLTFLCRLVFCNICRCFQRSTYVYRRIRNLCCGDGKIIVFLVTRKHESIKFWLKDIETVLRVACILFEGVILFLE